MSHEIAESMVGGPRSPVLGVEAPRPAVQGEVLPNEPGATATNQERSPLISVIVPVHNGSDYLQRCLAAVFASQYPHYECIVVDDSSTDDSAAVAARFPVQLLTLIGGPFGPACARNRAAEAAKGDLLFFVDADVVIGPEVLGQVAETLSRPRKVDAVFGSYDESPEAQDFVSQYRNLLHHFVHQQGHEEGGTFWSGCGAVRREVFLAMGGFDEARYPRASIEDIDLGYRLKAAGHQILLNKQMLAKHLKRWTLRSMTRADILDRGIPWTLLILRDRNLPNDLNLTISQRLSALLLCVIVLNLGLAAFFHDVAVLPLLAGLFLLVVGNTYWSGGVRLFGTRRRAELVTYLVLGGIVVLALQQGRVGILAPLAPLLLGLVVGRVLPNSSALWNRTYFTIMVLGLISAIVEVLLSFESWLVVPMLLLPLLIVLLNHRFYLFIARKRGLVFALAVVPFQLLFFAYSVLAFALGTGLYLWKARIRGPSWRFR